MKRTSPKIEKYLTESKFDKAMTSIAKSFAVVSETLSEHGKALARHDRSFEQILEEIRSIHEDNKYLKETLSGFVRHTTIQERTIDDLLTRVERLEAKVA